jgi:hypothetical protein
MFRGGVDITGCPHGRDVFRFVAFWRTAVPRLRLRVGGRLGFPHEQAAWEQDAGTVPETWWILGAKNLIALVEVNVLGSRVRAD